MYIVDEEQVENIYNKVKDLTINSFEGKTIIDPAIDIGDKIIVDRKPIIYQGEMTLEGRFIADISSKIQIKQKEETTVNKASQKVINRRVESRIDQAEGKISQLVEENSEFSQKISKVEQDVDSINQKVSNITDFTRETTSRNEIHLTDTGEGIGFVLDFIVKGSTENFKYLTPSNTLVPSNILVPNGGRFNVVCDKQSRGKMSNEAIIKEIIMEEPLRDYLGVYDELEIKDNRITVTRRIGQTKEGNIGDLYILDNEVVEDYGEISLSTFEENTYIYIKEFYNLEYYAQYLIKNDYLDTFATKVELSTSIEQNNTSIMSEVNKKVGEDEFGTLIEQNSEAIKYAWNQISEYIQLMIINGNANFAILDENNKVIMSLDKIGQHFYNQSEEIFGEMGVQKIEDEENETKKNYISFSVDGDYDSEIEDGMAWGIKTREDNKFWPILFIRNFHMPPKNSDFGSGGQLELNGCDLVLGSLGSGIVSGNIKIYGDPRRKCTIFY
ncbi:MAG: hypothetical protein HFJ59_04630 [Clostridia bacterium]|nr:hypothetical protein [Clostridia bacterium]